MEEVIGYIGAFVIGLILGLMGGGGSILTVPLLVYILLIDPVIATAYSLFIVGITSAFGSVQNHLKNNIAYKTGLLIAIPSFISVYLTRKFIVPALPDIIIELGGLIIYKDAFIMGLFATMMLLASLSMLRRKTEQKDKLKKTSYILIVPYVLFIGMLIGIVGAGGGFLLIPTLVFFGGLPMRKAVGTSLFIIAINSLMGFVGDIQNIIVDWGFLLPFSIISIFGIFAGIYLNKYINENQLKRGFGWFILVTALFILTEEIIGFKELFR
ncbi:MAG: sulfite exporter TauE/SafE family protein [Flavobacterium sp.]|nr:MAG: sulfite exporter TauE/SafE family protein [Flavobacterium sp.]